MLAIIFSWPYLCTKDLLEALDLVMAQATNTGWSKLGSYTHVFRIPEPIVVRYDGSKKKVSPSIIIKPAGPVPYSSDRVVPYRYNAVALEDGKEVSLPTTSVVSISDVNGVTRSGRVFSAPPKPLDDLRRTDDVNNSASPLAKLSYQGPPMRHNGMVVKAFDGSRKAVIGEVELPIIIGPSDFQITFQIDVEGEVGTQFQALSITEPSRKGLSSFASYNDAKLAIEHGITTGLGKMIKLEHNKSQASIGYSSGTFNERGLFQSRGFIHTVEDQEAVAIVEDDAEEDSGNFVIPGGVCNNWVAVDVSTVFHKSTWIKPIEHNDPTPTPNFEFPVFEAEEDDIEQIPDEIICLLEHKEKIIQPHLENLETVNLGSEDCVREVKIGVLLGESVKKGLIELLREYVDVFAWSYKDMPSLDIDIVQHFLPLKPGCVLVK
ncbi:hypothetical protein KIW84_053498 [Lathyrus oleraceus]|uniref:Reverse transcriptase domain-containing protein n=1 Tax=Pisum sativum TaxID=3888 RepID=A0A9D4WQL1_PEA|nr:hypothetical protein KIW84_053498 [Pisum sativum]